MTADVEEQKTFAERGFTAVLLKPLTIDILSKFFTAYLIPDEEKREQEIRSLLKIGDSFKKIVITSHARLRCMTATASLR